MPSSVASNGFLENHNATKPFDELVRMAGDQVLMTCNLMEKLVKNLDKYPDLPLSRIAPIKNVSLLEMFILLRRHTAIPQVAAVLQQISHQSQRDDRLVQHLLDSSDTAIESLQIDFNLIHSQEAGILAPVKFAGFLRAKAAELRRMESTVVELSKKHDDIVAEIAKTVSETGKNLEATLKEMYPTDQETAEFQARLEKCRSLTLNEILCLHVSWKVKFYTEERIAQIREKVTTVRGEITNLEREIGELSDKRLQYEALGPKFQQLVAKYREHLRDLKVRLAVLNAEASFSEDKEWD